MKKIFVTILAAFALAACSKDDNGGSSNDIQQLNIRIGGVNQASSRSVEAPAAQGQLVLENGRIFIINSLGAVVQNVALDVAAATSTGQTITTPVSSDARVYVVGNIPSSVDVTQLATLNQIRAHEVLLSHSEQTDYKTALLANDTGNPSSITKTDSTNTATANVTISPLYSRIELAEVKGGANVEKFNVTGVFVDDYFSSFTLAGACAGVIHHQSMSEDFTGNIGDAGTWASTGNLGVASATPGNGNVWAAHVASSGLPRLIVRLDHIYVDNDGEGGSASTMIGTTEGVRYITVTNYTGDNVPANFERGKIYKVNAITIAIDASGTDSNLGQEPNPTDVTVTADIEVIDWTSVVLTPETR